MRHSYAPIMVESVIDSLRHHDIAHGKSYGSGQPAVASYEGVGRDVALRHFQAVLHDVGADYGMHQGLAPVLARQSRQLPESSVKKRQSRDRVVACRYGHDAARRSAAKRGLFHNQHASVLAEVGGHAALDYERVISRVVRLKDPLTPHGHDGDRASAFAA